MERRRRCVGLDGRVMERAAAEIGIERVREGVDAAQAVAAER